MLIVLASSMLLVLGATWGVELVRRWRHHRTWAGLYRADARLHADMAKNARAYASNLQGLRDQAPGGDRAGLERAIERANRAADWHEQKERTFRHAVTHPFDPILPITSSRAADLRAVLPPAGLGTAPEPGSIADATEEGPEPSAGVADLEYLRGLLPAPGSGGQPGKIAAGVASLDLSGTPINDAGLAHLQGLSRLRSLCLAGTRITDDGLEALEGLAGLHWLILRDTPISDAGLAHLAGLGRLEDLDLAGTAVGDAGLAHLRGLEWLATLNLARTRVRGPGLVHLRNHPRLWMLDLSGTRLDDAGLAALEAGFGGLRMLNLRGTAVTDVGLSHLAGLPGLELVELDGTPATAAGKAELGRSRPGLRFQLDATPSRVGGR